MKKWKKILVMATMILSVAMLSACGENGNNADESPVENDSGTDADMTGDGVTQELDENTPDVADDTIGDENDNAQENNEVTKDKKTEDTNQNGTDGNVPENTTGNTTDTQNGDAENDGTVSGELGDSVKDLGDGVGDAVDDIGNAAGNALEGR